VTASFIAWIWPYAVVFFGAAGALVVAFVSGGNRQKDKRAAKDAKAAAKSTKDMNDADTLRDATDGQRIERLRQFERDNRS
jgi:hypothetical protein